MYVLWTTSRPPRQDVIVVSLLMRDTSPRSTHDSAYKIPQILPSLSQYTITPLPYRASQARDPKPRAANLREQEMMVFVHPWSLSANGKQYVTSAPTGFGHPCNRVRRSCAPPHTSILLHHIARLSHAFKCLLQCFLNIILRRLPPAKARHPAIRM